MNLSWGISLSALMYMRRYAKLRELACISVGRYGHGVSVPASVDSPAWSGVAVRNALLLFKFEREREQKHYKLLG